MYSLEIEWKPPVLFAPSNMIDLMFMQKSLLFDGTYDDKQKHPSNKIQARPEQSPRNKFIQNCYD